MKEAKESKSQLPKIAVQEISLPRGGGAVRGLSDSFQQNVFSGTCGYSVPVPVTAARGMEPQLTIDYNSGSGNSAFGLGFSLSLPKISIATEKRIPRYQGHDKYTLTDAGELVIKEDAVQNKEIANDNGDSFIVSAYLPRIESLFAKIEQWVSKESGISFWKVVSRDNVTSFFGRSDNARVFDPSKKSHIFEWLISESYDAKGNKIVYTYKSENKERVPDKVYEVNRSCLANRYIHSIKYGNYYDEQKNELFAFELIFDYGEYDLSDPGRVYFPVQEWDCRPDPFSSYKSGFEIRTYRLCRNILLFHHFPQELSDPCIVRSMSLTHENLRSYASVQQDGFSLLTSITVTGYRKDEKDNFVQQQLPPLDLKYSSFDPPSSPAFKTLSVREGSIPGYLDDSQFLPVDLNGDGLPGFLYSNDRSTVYFEPQGDGKYSSGTSLNAFPVSRDLQGGQALLSDIDGNGRVDLVIQQASKAGYYRHKEDGEWENFQPFTKYPNTISNPRLEIVDLDGDGKADLLLAENSKLEIYYSEGLEGFSLPSSVSNNNDFPLRKQNDEEVQVAFADIFGDGLAHRVKISNGLVECWPCLGYGRYGEKIILGNAPVFDEDFKKSRLFLADIDGSGFSDLVYVYPGRVDIFLNQGGNYFSTPVSIRLPDIFTDIDQISFSDILGNGTSCIVFTKIAPVPVHYYYSFVGEITCFDGISTQSLKPYLLNEINNNMGTITRVQYASSTKFYLEDKLTGRPWKTKLSFPVQVVEEMLTCDLVSGARNVVRYKYHDGYYDTTERQFHGFGFIESWDSETLEAYGKSVRNSRYSVNTINNEFYIPPVYTKTWYMTGAFMDYNDILESYRKEFYRGDGQALDFPGCIIAPEIYDCGSETVRQAFVALKGQEIRKEIYADDQTADATKPYTVEQSNAEVLLLQAASRYNNASFMVNLHESIVYSYERNPEDPQIRQQFVLETDLRCGQPALICKVFLPRRKIPGSAEPFYKEQHSLVITVTRNYYINTDDDKAYRYRGILYDTREFELFGGDLGGASYFSFDKIREQVLSSMTRIIPYMEPVEPGILAARQYLWERIYFWDEAQEKAMSAGEISSRALLHHQSSALFTKNNIVRLYGERLVDDFIQNEAGYFFDTETGYWQNRGLVQHYYNTKESFYVSYMTANSFVDPGSSLYAKSVTDYDQYYLLPVKTTGYLDEPVKNELILVNDYQVMKPARVIDINKNVSDFLYDPLSQVIVSSFFGKENGVETGGMRLFDYQDKPAEYIKRENDPDGRPITFDSVLNNSAYYLQGATSYFFYDLNAFRNGMKEGNIHPVNSITIVRPNYYHYQGTITSFSCEMTIEYSDGRGRSIEKKKMADAGLAILRDTSGRLLYNNNKVVRQVVDERWMVSGRTVYNNKDMPCEVYLSYFSNTPYYETQQEITDEGLVPAPTVFHYDPLSRLIRTDTPKKFFTKIEYRAWEKKLFDEDDTVLDSKYYTYFMEHYPVDPTREQKDEKDALEKAAVFFNTPTIKVLDNAGVAFLSIQTLEDKRQLITFLETDITGRVITSIDPRLYEANLSQGKDYYNFKYMYAMGDEQALYTDSVDAGVQRYLRNIFTSQVWSWSARNYCQVTSYDRLQRQTALRVKKMEDNRPGNITDDFNLVEIITYGETRPDAEAKNLRGQIYQANDLSGIVINHQYSLLEKAMQTSRQMVIEYKTAVDWNQKVELEPEKDVQTVSYTYNGLGYLLTETTPDKTIISYAYNHLGLADQIDLKYEGGDVQKLVNHIEYDANLQRQRIEYDNGVWTEYTREQTTLRLQKLLTKRPAGKTRTAAEDNTLQDICYTYDPVGNVTRIWDDSFEPVFHNNQEVKPLSSYRYDAIYRLTHSCGRQHPGININTYKNNLKDSSFKQSIFSNLAAINDGEALEIYKEIYTYDDGGNLTQTQHIAKSASFTRENLPEAYCNRIKGIEYDASGNQRQLDINNRVPLSYNCCENMLKAGIIERPDEPDDCDYYLYDNAEIRTRKVCERLVQAGSSTEITETTYLGNYEIKRNKTVNASGNISITLERHSLRVTDGSACIAIIHYWKQDDLKRETQNAGDRSIRFQLANELGSVAMEVDNDALLISYEEYFPFGGTAIIAGKSQQEVAMKDYRYSGKECDDSTGLYYYGARYYISWLGRWTKPDPAGSEDGLNLYTFVNNNPLIFKDPEGMSKRPKSELTMNKESEQIGARIGKDIAKLSKKDVTTWSTEFQQINTDIEMDKKAEGIDLQKDATVKRAIDAGLKGDKKEFSRLYRDADPGMDEHLSTASVFGLLKGIGQAPLSKDQRAAVEQAFTAISQMRLPTNISGYNESAQTAQHPTSRGEEFWDSSGKNHGYWNRERREDAMEVAISNPAMEGFELLKAMAAEATRHTLAYGVAPAEAKNVKTLPKATPARRGRQVKEREVSKRSAKRFGAKQKPHASMKTTEKWSRKRSRSLSPERK